MGKSFKEIDKELTSWIEEQKMFFVATAPLAQNGLINLSPKGLDTFRILNSSEVAYLDLTGSGVETIAHIKENKRIVLMFCAFNGPPRILRIYGTGTVIEKSDPEFVHLFSLFANYHYARSIIKIKSQRIADSCGFGVPLYEFQKQRETMAKWANNKGKTGIKKYQVDNNLTSLEGLSGLMFPDPFK